MQTPKTWSKSIHFGRRLSEVNKPTLLGDCHGRDPTRRSMRTRVRGNTCACIIITVWGHSKGECLKICTYFLCEVDTQVSRISVCLAFCVCKRPASKVGTDLWVLQNQEKTKGGRGYVYWINIMVEIIASKYQKKLTFFWMCTRGHIPPATSSRMGQRRWPQ